MGDIVRKIRLYKLVVPHIKNNMKLKSLIKKNTIFGNVILIVFGIILFFTIVSIMADGWIDLRIAFWILVPLLISYSIILFLFGDSTIRLWKSLKIRFAVSFLLVLINLILFALNLYTWIDLFDGRTNALLP